jgi:hypothetical protein
MKEKKTPRDFQLHFRRFTMLLKILHCLWVWDSPGKPGLQRATQEWIASRVPLAHACNPSNSGGKDEEDHVSMPAQVNSLRDPISKKPITKKGWWSDSRHRL